MRDLAFFSDMKTKRTKKVLKEETLPVDTTTTEISGTTTNPPPSTTGGEGVPSTTSKVASFSGDFGRQDINLLRDKVNEIINIINSK